MALDLAFRRLGFLPGLIQTGNGEPRKAHWLGNRQSSRPQPDQEQGRPDDPAPRQPDPRGYRSLGSLALGEVEDAYLHFKAQLVPSPVEGWVARNYFCQLPLRRYSGERPPVVFGRVKSIYPYDGQIHNVEELELFFPIRHSAPELLHIHDHDLALQKPAQTYCIGVKFYLSDDEMKDFSQSENIFLEKGFAPLYDNGYLDLLDGNKPNHTELPWLYVIGSEWFASIPDSIQPEIRAHLHELVRWNKVVFNYHPRRHTLRYLSLNEELDFHYGFTEHFLIAPQNTEQTLKQIEAGFAEIFLRGIG